MSAVAFRNAGLAAVRGRGYAITNPELRMNLAINSRQLSLDVPFWKRDIVFTFIVVSALTLLFCGTIFVGSIKRSLLPEILGDFSDSSYSVFAPSDKDSFLLRLNAGEQRKLAAQVHYVGEIIRTTRSSAKEINRLAYAIVLESRKVDMDPLFVAAVIKVGEKIGKF